MELFLCHNIVGVRCNPSWHKQPGYRWFWKNSWWSFLHCTCTLKKRTNHLKIVINGILPHDDYSFELHQERVCGQVPHPLLLLPSFTYPHILTLLTSNSLLMIAWLASQLSNCLSLIHTFIPDKAQMNKWSSSFIREVSFHLIFVFEGLSCNILWFSKPDKDNS